MTTITNLLLLSTVTLFIVACGSAPLATRVPSNYGPGTPPVLRSSIMPPPGRTKGGILIPPADTRTPIPTLTPPPIPVPTFTDLPTPESTVTPTDAPASAPTLTATKASAYMPQQPFPQLPDSSCVAEQQHIQSPHSGTRVNDLAYLEIMGTAWYESPVPNHGKYELWVLPPEELAAIQSPGSYVPIDQGALRPGERVLLTIKIYEWLSRFKEGWYVLKLRVIDDTSNYRFTNPCYIAFYLSNH